MRNLAIILSVFFVFSEARSAQLYFVDYGIHTAIVFPLDFIKKEDERLYEAFKDHTYLEFSFGEEPFFRSKTHGKLDIMAALFWPSQSLIRLHPFSRDPLEHYSQSASLAILDFNDEQSLKILNLVLASFLDKTMLEPWLEYQEGKQRYFVLAKGNYHILNNCNDWMARIFESVGIKVRLISKFSSGELFEDIVHQSKNAQRINFTSEKYLKYLR